MNPQVERALPRKARLLLEGQGIFSFGGVAELAARGERQRLRQPDSADVPVMFFSRRIGLVEGGEVPIDIGGRVTGKTGP